MEWTKAQNHYFNVNNEFLPMSKSGGEATEEFLDC